ncbi:helix-turn-helix domain-containing protein [Nocardia sp. NPDC048505]|uniref:MmyB family transcriptional regulator n=1 Tax=unclassified Nocardia TaxID=2637762 RepID=UPI0033FF0C5D
MNSTSRSRPKSGRSTRSHRPKIWPPQHIPDFGLWVWRFRDYYRDITQDELARRGGFSNSLVRKIESNNHLPDRLIVDQIINVLGLDEAQQRLLTELWYPAIDLTPIDYLRSRFTDAGGLETLEYHHRHGTPAMAHNFIWDVLAANSSAKQLMPGIEEAENNYLLWTFSPAARPAFADWDHEAPQLAAIALGVLARHRQAPRAQHVYNELLRKPEFAKLMPRTTTVAYGCQPDKLIHRFDATTGDSISMSVQTSDHFGTHEVFLTCGFKHLYSGPAR